MSDARKQVRLRRTLGTFLAWGGGSGSASAFFLVFFSGIVLIAGNVQIGALLLVPLVVVTVVWLSGRTVIDGDVLETGCRFRPKIYRRHDVESVSRDTMALGRWIAKGLVLNQNEGGKVELRFSGGLKPTRLGEWEAALWAWLADADLAAQPPIFALAGDDPTLLVFRSITEAERYAEVWDVNDGLWTFWDRNACLLSHPEHVDERSGRTSLVSTGVLDRTRLRVLLIDALEVPVAEMASYSTMEMAELVDVAAQLIGFS